MAQSQNYYKAAKKVIPGGTQLLSKRPEMFLPDYWPSYYKKSKGCEVWDLDGKKYTDMSYMGIGSCTVGYADKDINIAVKQAIDKGNMNTLNAPEELELAKLLCQIHSWAHMVRYARTGGEAMAIAVRIARAASGKDKVLFCGYHGWHDWYLSSNLADDKSLDGHLLPGLEPKGVPRSLKGTSFPFNYNDIDAFLKLIEDHKNEVATVVMEPIREHFPKKGFLETIRKTTQELGITLIFDEVSSGFRLNLGGAHLVFNINPDIAVFSKALGNGYPIAAIIGTKHVMKAAQETFISSTNWTDRLGPSAAIAVIKKYKKNNIPKHLNSIGKKIQEGWKSLALKHKLDIEVGGIYPLGHFSFKSHNPLVLKTLFTQLMLEEGFLATTAFYSSYAHKEKHVSQYLKAVDKTFAFVSKAAKEGKAKTYLKGKVCHAGFRRLT